MMTLTEIKQHNAARRRALQEKKAQEQQPQPEPEEVRKETKGRRPKNRRALVVEEIEEPVQEEVQEEIPQPEAPEIEPQEEGE